jgi:hypothetical protein
MGEGGSGVERQQSHGTRGGKYIPFHDEDVLLLKDVSIPHCDSREKAPPALSPSAHFYSFCGTLARKIFKHFADR